MQERILFGTYTKKQAKGFTKEPLTPLPKP